MKRETIRIEGMSCNHCVMAVKKELGRLPLKTLEVQIGSADVEYEEDKVKHDDLVKAVEEAGYRVII